jgi:hypothetical protein
MTTQTAAGKRQREQNAPPASIAVRALPALGMTALLVIGGMWSGTIRHDPSPAFLARWGYDLDALRAGRIDTLFTMTLFPTAHSDWLPMLLQSIILVALMGWFAGPWWAVAGFWVPNIFGTAVVSLCIIWPLDAAGYGFAHGWAIEPDSGASVGIYGALGFLLALLPRRLRRLPVMAMAAWLILGIVRERHVWNTEHLGGYLLGVSLAMMRSRWRRVRTGGRRGANERRTFSRVTARPTTAPCYRPMQLRAGDHRGRKRRSTPTVRGR